MSKFNIFKNIIKKINIIKSQKELFDSLNSGDLVWAKMPLSKKKLSLISETHQIRPYLIMHKDHFFIYAYQSSSKQSINLNNCEEYCINRLRYKQNKNSFINLTRLHKIPLTNLKSKYITLNNFDIKSIQKRLQVPSNKSKYQFSVTPYILEGDVVSINNQLYYVYASDNAFIYCVTVFKKCPKNKANYKQIIINNKTYYTTFKEKLEFKRTTSLAIVNIAYQNEIESILDLKNGFDYDNKKLSNLQKKSIEIEHELIYEGGTVFKIGRSKIVYLFKYKTVHYGIDMLMYQIKPKAIPIFDIEKRQILEILPLDKYLNIVEFLSLNNVHPLKEIQQLYYDLRISMYSS